MKVDATTILQIVLASGVLTTVATVVRSLLTRRKTRIDTSQVVQGMTLQLVEPLQRRLAEADKKIDQLSEKLDKAIERAERAEARAEAAEDALRRHRLPFPDDLEGPRP